MTRSRFSLVSCLCISLLSVLALSHMGKGYQDPLGDVSPHVRVENGHFVVYFRNNVEKPVPDSSGVEETEHSPSYRVYRTIISRQGQIVVQREPAAEPPVLRPDVVLPDKDKEWYIYVKEEQGSWLVFPPWGRMHHGRPFMIRLTDGKREIQQFDWGRDDVDEVHDVVACGDEVVFLVSFGDLFRSSSITEPDPFYFCRFSKDGRRCSAFQKVGIPRRIFTSSVCSNIVAQSPRYMVSWVLDQHLILSTWDSSSNTLKSQLLPDPIDGHSSISSARIDNMMLIAYGEKGTIKTKMVDLTNSQLVLR